LDLAIVALSCAHMDSFRGEFCPHSKLEKV
jgi:hypothetical protein